MAESKPGLKVHKRAIRELPRSGSPDELVDHFGIVARNLPLFRSTPMLPRQFCDELQVDSPNAAFAGLQAPKAGIVGADGVGEI